MRHIILTCWFTVTLIVGVIAIGTSWAAEPVSFVKDVAPILMNNCVACHDAKKAEGGYRIDSYDELVKVGDSGEPPVARTKEESSELLRRIVTADESERMPAESKALAPKEIELIKSWIEAGGTFDGKNSSDPLSLVIPTAEYADPPESYGKPIPIAAIAFSPDGKQLVCGGYHELTVWDTKEPKLVRRIKNIGQRVFAIAFDPSGKTIAVACGEPGRIGELRLVDFDTGQIKAVMARAGDVVSDVAFRPGGHELAVASADSLIRIFNVETHEELRTIASHADRVTAVAYSDDGSRLVSASRDKSAKVFDATTGDLLTSYAGHSAPVRGITILPDGKHIVSAGADGKLHRWNTEGGKRITEVNLGGEPFKLIRGQGFIIVPCADKRLRKIDLSNNKITQEYQGHDDWVLSTALGPEGNWVASGAFSGDVRIWNTADGSLVQSWLAKP